MVEYRNLVTLFFCMEKSALHMYNCFSLIFANIKHSNKSEKIVLMIDPVGRGYIGYILNYDYIHNTVV